MKKWSKYLFIFVIVIVTIVGWLIIDSLRVIEEPLTEVAEIAKEIDGDNIKGMAYAYTLERTDDKIIHTYYYAADRVKTITTYYINDGVVIKAYRENHFTTKANARRTTSELVDREIKGNVVKGWLKLENVNQLSDELYNLLESETSKGAKKLN